MFSAQGPLPRCDPNWKVVVQINDGFSTFWTTTGPAWFSSSKESTISGAASLVLIVQACCPGFLVKLILLVDDSRFQRITNERLLVRAGYEVVTAGDGEEALRIASSRAPDLVILDMLLPKLSGPEVLKSLTTNPTTASIPVVVLSSLTQANETRLIEEGASAYLEKSRIEGDPNFSALLTTVARTLKNKPRVLRSGSPHLAPQEPTRLRGEWDFHAKNKGQP